MINERLCFEFFSNGFKRPGHDTPYMLSTVLKYFALCKALPGWRA